MYPTPRAEQLMHLLNTVAKSGYVDNRILIREILKEYDLSGALITSESIMNAGPVPAKKLV